MFHLGIEGQSDGTQPRSHEGKPRLWGYIINQYYIICTAFGSNANINHSTAHGKAVCPHAPIQRLPNLLETFRPHCPQNKCEERRIIRRKSPRLTNLVIVLVIVGTRNWFFTINTPITLSPLSELPMLGLLLKTISHSLPSLDPMFGYIHRSGTATDPEAVDDENAQNLWLYCTHRQMWNVWTTSVRFWILTTDGGLRSDLFRVLDVAWPHWWQREGRFNSRGYLLSFNIG